MTDALKFDDETLANTLHLMKSRSGEAVLKSEGRQLLNETNVLLKNGLMNNLLSSIKEDVTKYCKKIPATAAPTDQTVTNLATIRLKAEIVFFICYQSQLVEPEALALIELIKFLSDMLVSEAVDPQQQSQQLGLGGQSLSQSAELDWGPPVYSLLVILQLAHVGALQQTTYLLPRDVDYSQAQYQNCRSIEDVVEVGNTLPQAPGSRCGMEAPLSPRGPATSSKEWQCDGAKGFACLAFSVLRQPDVDVDKAPASDVEWFLHEACRLRAYSYIRLCMVPVLQAAYLQDKETSLFYVAVLCELLENLAKIFCMTHYKQVHAHNENDFPYVFFPPTEEFYAQNMSFYADRLSALGGGDLGEEPAAAVDSLEDVMSVYTAVLELRPEFAHTFWPSIQSQDIQVQHQKHQQSMAQTSEHHDIVDHYYHPFVMKAVDASFHHPRLMIAAIRFVAAMSNSPLGRTAYAGYLFVLDSHHHMFSWDHFFKSMDHIALQLGASLSTAAAPTASGFGPNTPSFSTQRAQEQQQQLVQAHHFLLTEKDAEGLVAIMRLIAAVSVHPDVATLLHETFRPIPRLFALLSCALPISLKGAILKALSVFARGSPTVSEEIWALVESHRLLPITHTPFGTTSGLGQQRKQGVHGRGLRVELEEAESRAGRYPITEGFLQLLGALLSHGTPDNALGLGYRRPGLSVYLDYVIEDVLLKSHERQYRPNDWPSAYAQRWRISSLCLSILGTLLQNYPVNAVPHEEASLAALQSPQLAEVIADFREDAVEYNIEGFTTPQRCSRPKTAAFSVMHLLLGKSRLFDYMSFLLAECSAESIANSFNEHCLSEVGAAVDLLQKLHSLAHPEGVRARAEGSFDFSLPLAANLGGFRASAAAAAAAREVAVQEPLDLTALGRETYLGDAVFWQERTVAGVVGLIYECSLREGRFMSLYRAAPTKLSVTRTNDQGRITVGPVTCHDLSELLSADQDRGLLALIAQVVPMHVRSCPCLPAVNVLSVRVLEHVALHLPASRLLAALIPSQAQQQRVFRDPSQPQPSFLLSEHHEAAGYLIEGCAAALRTEVDVSVEQNDGSLHYDVVCLGGEAYPYFYSLSSAYTRNTSPPNLYLTMINADSTEEAAQVDAEYIRALRLGGTIREAVLHLLLRTLTPNAACLSHQLLGLAPSVASVLAAGSGVRSDSTIANKMMAEGCLAAVLHVLSPQNMPLGTTFIQQSPEQAADCFELLYRLCSSPLTSGIVLRRLSERQVDFFRSQITLVLYLMHLSDEELLEGADVTLFTTQQAASGTNTSQLNPNFAVLQSIKAALASCASWLLKACTLSLRHSELSRTSGAATHATLLLRLLYGSCSALSFGEERGSQVSVLEKLLDFATDFPIHPYSSFLPTASMQQYLQAAGLEQTLAKAGSGWGDFNQFQRQDAVHAEVMSYTVVDLRLLSSLVKAQALQPQPQQHQRGVRYQPSAEISPEELRAGLNTAVLLNMHAKHEAARNHLCAAWCQLVNLTVASSATQLLLLQISDGNLSAPRSLDEYATRPSVHGPGTARDLAQLVFEQLFVPVSQVLVSRTSRLHMQRSILPELFARCMMAQVRVLTSVGANVGVACPLLMPDQHARMAESVVQLLLLHRDGALSRPGDGGVMTTANGAPFAAVSGAYRGLLASALEQILQVPAKLSGPAVTGSTLGASEEGKNYFTDAQADQERKEAIQAEYRSLNMDALERRVGELVDALGRDCAQQGPAVWRLCSVTALSSILCVFSDKNSGAYGSHIFVQALQVLVQRGHLQAILSHIASTAPYPAPVSTASAADEKGQESLFMSALTLCVHIAGTPEGAEALLSCDLMQRLVAVNHFVTPPPFPDEIAYFGADAIQSREEAVAQLQSRYQMAIDLLRCLFASLPASHVIAAGAAEFLRKNQVLVTQLLRMRYLSLGGLGMTEGTLAVLSMLAAVPRSPLTNGANKSNSAVAEGTQALSALGSVADVFLVDVSSLLGVIGANPVPSSLSATYGGVSSSRGSWWDHIQPAEGSYEQQWHRAQCTGPEGAGMPAGWTVFDARKLQLGLQIVSHAAVLLRLVSSPLIVRRHRDLQAVSASAVAEAYCRCAALSEQLRASTSSNTSSHTTSASYSHQDTNNRVLERAAGLIGAPLGGSVTGPSVDWLRSPLAVSAPFSRYSAAEAAHPTSTTAAPRASTTTVTTTATSGGLKVDVSESSGEEGRLAVAEALLVVAENLVCVVHSLAQLQAQHRAEHRSGNGSGSGGVSGVNGVDAAAGAAVLSVEATQRVLEASAAFPAHSFIRQVARWVKDLTQH